MSNSSRLGDAWRLTSEKNGRKKKDRPEGVKTEEILELQVKGEAHFQILDKNKL